MTKAENKMPKISVFPPKKSIPLYASKWITNGEGVFCSFINATKDKKNSVKKLNTKTTLRYLSFNVE